MRSLVAACAVLVMSCENVPRDTGLAGPGLLGGTTFPNTTSEDGGFASDGGFDGGFVDGGTPDGGSFRDGGFVGSGLPCAVNPPDAGFAFFSPCPPGEYCRSPNCEGGICVQRPTGKLRNNMNLQCGCDRVTYWNPDVAAAAGASIAFPGECLSTIGCGGINNGKCTAPGICNFRQFSMNECNISDPVGTCWVLPPDCPVGATTIIPSHSCVTNTCIDLCTVIRQGHLWFQDPTCSPFTP
jgi:hypothetical protein